VPDEAAPTDRRETFALGVCMYPEQWPRDRWASYARRFRELGIAYARIAEFAWSRMEPAPGRYDWAWLDAAIATLAEAGLKVVLGTPTAAPPAWLVRAHPEILPVDAEGRRRNHGGRRHYDPASPVYREHSRRIVDALATRYGEHPAVVGWQTDNEFGDGLERSYGPASQAAFRTWLAARYHGDIAALNNTWGAVFWSQEYSSFDQIDPPNLVVEAPNPSHVLDYARFASAMFVEFQQAQIDILRRRSPGRWITHNFMRLFGAFDHYAAAANLDFASWDSYPTGGVEYSSLSDADKARWARTGHPDLVAVNHDLYRGLKGNRGFWVMEQQNGQINWAPHNPLPARGAVALWTAQTYAHGGDVVSYFRDRAATMAQELMHSGLLRHDETLDRGGEEVAALEIVGLPNAAVAAPVALLHDYESLWAYDAQPHDARANYWDQFLLFYTALRSLGVDVDIRHPDHDLDGHRLIVAPALQLLGPERAAHLTRVAAATPILFGPRTAYRTPTGRVHDDGQPGPLRPLLGCRLRNFDSMRPGLVARVGEHPVEIWAESYEPLPGAVVTHRYADGPLAGEAAVIRHGDAITLGAWSPALIHEVVMALLAEVGVPATPLPEGVRVARRGQLATWMNFNEAPATLPDGTILPPVSFEMRPV
jgi:beta-galactosidase